MKKNWKIKQIQWNFIWEIKIQINFSIFKSWTWINSFPQNFSALHINCISYSLRRRTERRNWRFSVDSSSIHSKHQTHTQRESIARLCKRCYWVFHRLLFLWDSKTPNEHSAFGLIGKANDPNVIALNHQTNMGLMSLLRNGNLLKHQVHRQITQTLAARSYSGYVVLWVYVDCVEKVFLICWNAHKTHAFDTDSAADVHVLIILDCRKLVRMIQNWIHS